jgi:hypothetical protein
MQALETPEPLARFAPRPRQRGAPGRTPYHNLKEGANMNYRPYA